MRVGILNVNIPLTVECTPSHAGVRNIIWDSYSSYNQHLNCTYLFIIYVRLIIGEYGLRWTFTIRTRSNSTKKEWRKRVVRFCLFKSVFKYVNVLRNCIRYFFMSRSLPSFRAEYVYHFDVFWAKLVQFKDTLTYNCLEKHQVGR